MPKQRYMEIEFPMDDVMERAIQSAALRGRKAGLEEALKLVEGRRDYWVGVQDGKMSCLLGHAQHAQANHRELQQVVLKLEALLKEAQG